MVESGELYVDTMQHITFADGLETLKQGGTC